MRRLAPLTSWRKVDEIRPSTEEVTIMRELIKGAATGLLLAGYVATAAGCPSRVTDFTVISTKNTMIVAHAEKYAKRVEGEDCTFTLLGLPDMKTAIDDAIEKAGDDYDALVDGVVWYDDRFFYVCYRVEGTPLRALDAPRDIQKEFGPQPGGATTGQRPSTIETPAGNQLELRGPAPQPQPPAPVVAREPEPQPVVEEPAPVAATEPEPQPVVEEAESDALEPIPARVEDAASEPDSVVEEQTEEEPDTSPKVAEDDGSPPADIEPPTGVDEGSSDEAGPEDSSDDEESYAATTEAEDGPEPEEAQDGRRMERGGDGAGR